MNLAEAMGLMEPVVIKQPGPGVLEFLSQVRGARFVSLSTFKVTAEGMCAWCQAAPVAKGRKKYCGEACIEWASWATNPHSPAVKAWIFLNAQEGACHGCGEAYDEELVARIQARLKAHQRQAQAWNEAYPDEAKPIPEKLSWWLLGHGTGERWELDHIQPLHKGGAGIEFSNLQVLCIPCHRRKTAEERGYVPQENP